MGDWNINFSVDISSKRALNDILLPNGFENIVKFVTRVNGNAGSSIDCVVTNIKSPDIRVKALATGVSDHDAQLARVILEKEKAKPERRYTEMRPFNQEKVENFCNAMLAYEWDHIFSKYNDDTFHKFMDKVLWNMSVYFPTTKRDCKFKRKCPWICDRIMKLQHDINDLHIILRQYPDTISENCPFESKIKYRNELINKQKNDYVENRIRM